MSESSINAIWVDPLEFDALDNGPPYLPERKRVLMASNAEDNMERFVKWFDAPLAELGVVVAMLRAGALLHQTHHWQTRGNSFYGDHLLFERLYNESLALIDQVAERAVGAGSRVLVCPKHQAGLVNSFVQVWASQDSVEPSPDEMIRLSLNAEVFILRAVKIARERLESAGTLSDGTDNLLQGVADKHEEFMYLLQQRLETNTDSYDRRR